MTTGPRDVYAEAAAVAVDLVGSGEVAARWGQDSVLPGMAVGALAAHLARSVLQVEWYLDAPVTDGPLVTARTYYARLEGTTVPGSDLNTGVRRRSETTALDGPAAVAAQAREALGRLRGRLPGEPPGRRVAVLHRQGEEMLLDEYLRTRCVEIAVHTEDLALGVGSPVRAPRRAVALAVDLLVAAARQRSGDVAVLHALARRERDTAGALRVL
ncbi:hypothetical protein NUM3379_22280 [Kineococcus sp. NUM-3379]